MISLSIQHPTSSIQLPDSSVSDAPNEQSQTHPAWDEFLQQSDLGQFQQASGWAAAKAAEWRCTRVLQNDAQGIAGGFQLLWRQTRFGRIGYVSKGPVPREDTPEAWNRLVPLLQQAVSQLGLRSIIVQPPDFAQAAAPELRRFGFEDNCLYPVIQATWLVDLNDGLPAVETGFRTDTRQNIRVARRDGFVVRKGRSGDVPIFFRMMRAMCQRLGTRPSPGEGELTALYGGFHERNMAEILVAERDSEPLGALLLLRVGRRMTSWKQACDPARLRRRPDALLYHEAFQHAIASGCHWFDFASFDPALAKSWASGQPLPRQNLNSRDFFHVGFGGRAVVLPPAMIWFPSRALRLAYRAAVRSGGMKLFKSMAGRMARLRSRRAAVHGVR